MNYLINTRQHHTTYIGGKLQNNLCIVCHVLKTCGKKQSEKSVGYGETGYMSEKLKNYQLADVEK